MALPSLSTAWLLTGFNVQLYLQHLSPIFKRNTAMVTGQPVRRLAQLIHRYHLEELLSQVMWLALVSLFARWTQLHYHPPADGIPWLGMTIRTSVFAFWSQVAREWLALRWWHPADQQPDRH